jgi:anaerobic nitric oxide reductase transcription regulator
VQRALLRCIVHRSDGGDGRAPLELRWDDTGLTDAAADAPPPSALALPARDADSLRETLERTRKQALEQALADAEGNVAAAARRLGLSRSFAYKEALRLGLIQKRTPRRR